MVQRTTTTWQSIGIVVDTLLCLSFFGAIAILSTKEWIEIWKIKKYSHVLDNKKLMMIASIVNVICGYFIVLYTARFLDYISIATTSIYLFLSILQTTWYITAIYFPKSRVAKPYSNVTIMALQFAMFYCVFVFIFYRWSWYLYRPAPFEMVNKKIKKKKK